MSETTWIERYYDALNFFYWEPQHLGRKKPAFAPAKTEGQVLRSLHSMEVTLNQILNQFFSLAPLTFRNRVFERALGRPIPGEFLLANRNFISGRDAEFHRPPWDTCQPDFLFSALDGSSNVFVEMKIDATSNCDQVLKYVALALSLEQASNKEMQHSLIFLGKQSFRSLWNSRSFFSSIDELRSGVIENCLTFFGKHKGLTGSLEQRFAAILSSLELGFINYQDLADLLEAERARSSDLANGVYDRLIAGLQGELGRRGLTAAK